MTPMVRWILIGAAMLLSTTPLTAKPKPWTDNYGTERSASIPKKVRKFVIDAQACAHFSGEEGYDADRAAFLAKMIKKTCTNIEDRREKLLTKHRGNAEIEMIIAEVWEPFA
jgi:hypothetical protein